MANIVVQNVQLCENLSFIKIILNFLKIEKKLKYN